MKKAIITLALVLLTLGSFIGGICFTWFMVGEGYFVPGRPAKAIVQEETIETEEELTEQIIEETLLHETKLEEAK